MDTVTCPAAPRDPLLAREMTPVAPVTSPPSIARYEFFLNAALPTWPASPGPNVLLLITPWLRRSMTLAVTVTGPALPLLSLLASEQTPELALMPPSADSAFAFTVTGPASPLAKVLLLICPV